MTQVTYLSIDSLAEGVGASQVLAYVEQMPRHGLHVRLVSLEKTDLRDGEIARRLDEAGVSWDAIPFGRHGAWGGLVRVLRASRKIRGATLVHARSDLAAAAALVARVPKWVWDARSLYADQKIELGELRPGSPEERVLRFVETQSALSSSGIVVLTDAARQVLADRYGADVATRVRVIPTCVDLERFTSKAFPPGATRFLVAGTLNAFYDVPTMIELVRRFRRDRDATFAVASPDASRWERHLEGMADESKMYPPNEMPNVIAASHVGLCVCRDDAGVSLAASMPTKIGEFLACGRPIVVNESLRDAAALVARYQAGVVITRSGGLEQAVDEIIELLEDPETPERCRTLAGEHFDLRWGVSELADMYREIEAAATQPKPPILESVSFVFGRMARDRFPRLTGHWDAWWDRRNPDVYRFGGPFNGQMQRQNLVRALFDVVPFELVVETGTHRGTTTAFLAELTDAPVESVEALPRYFFYARRRFRGESRVDIHEGDSRDFLRQLARTSNRERPTFFYLDAHWGKEVPLAEELDIIIRGFDRWVAIVDDFQIPNDPGYGFDDYGSGHALTLEYLPPDVQEKTTLYFPTVPSEVETGQRRGCLILAHGDTVVDALEALDNVERWPGDTVPS